MDLIHPFIHSFFWGPRIPTNDSLALITMMDVKDFSKTALDLLNLSGGQVDSRSVHKEKELGQRMGAKFPGASVMSSVNNQKGWALRVGFDTF